MPEDKPKKAIMNDLREYLNKELDGDLVDKNFLCNGVECFLVNIEELYENVAQWALETTNIIEQIITGEPLTQEEINKILEKAASGETWKQAIENYTKLKKTIREYQE